MIHANFLKIFFASHYDNSEFSNMNHLTLQTTMYHVDNRLTLIIELNSKP